MKLLAPRERTPARPGPGAMSAQLLHALELTTARRVDALLSGDMRSSLLGRGSELAQVRAYRPGDDDVRQIDWNVTARTGEPHVRVQLAERVLVTWLVLDTSLSMSFGTADRRKADVAEGTMLALGYAATRRGNRVGLVTFGDGSPRELPPRQGRAGLIGVLLSLRDEPDERPVGATSLAEALSRVEKITRQRSLVVVVSDLRGSGPEEWRRPLLQVAGRHDVVMVEIRDPREQELPAVGELRLVDPETGRQLRVDTGNARLRLRFAEAAAAERKRVASTLTGAGARHIVLSTEGDWLRTLVAYLRT